MLYQTKDRFSISRELFSFQKNIVTPNKYYISLKGSELIYGTNYYSEYKVIIEENHKKISTSFRDYTGLPILLYICNVLKFKIPGNLLKII